MPNMKDYNFDRSDIPSAKDVKDTDQLEPRTGEARFERSENELKRYSKDHPSFGGLGDRSLRGDNK